MAESRKAEQLKAWVRDYVQAVREGHVHPFSLLERRARAATRDEPW